MKLHPMNLRHVIGSAVLATVIGAGAASASIITDTGLSGSINVGGTSVDVPFGAPTVDAQTGDFEYAVHNFDAGNGITVDWVVDGNADPIVTSAISVTNHSGSTQPFTFTSNLPTTITGPARMGGSTAGSLTDADFSGSAALTNTGALPIYTAQIDGATALTLLNSPQSFTVSQAGGSTIIGSTSSGLPGLTLGAPGVNNSISILTQFTLTNGDAASFTSQFQVESVPEPTMIGLGAIAMSGLLMRRRRV